MERIASLIEQLQQAQQTNADASHLLMLVNNLQAEIQKQIPDNYSSLGTKRVAVVLPGIRNMVDNNYKSINTSETPSAEIEIEEQKIMEVLQVDEKEVEAELEEIRQKAEYAKKMQAQQFVQKPILLFEDEPEIPTLIHQPKYQKPLTTESLFEINEVNLKEKSEVNDKLKFETKEVAHTLTETSPIKDLKKAIGINDRFVFINELFRGDETMYERSIKTINNFSIYPEAQYWMERELKVKLGWDDKRPSTMEFYALVKRRFT